MIRNEILLVALMVLVSCSSATVEEKMMVSVDPTEKRVATLDEAFADVNIVRLDDSDVLLGRVNHLQVYKGDIYVLTGSKTNGVYRFDSNGQFLNTIGFRGDGPGEYGNIQSFAFADDTILVMDNDKMSVHSYSTKGEYLSTVKTGLTMFDILPLSSGDFMLYAGNTMEGERKKLLVFGADGVQKQGYLSVDAAQAEFLNIMPQKVFTKDGLFLEPFSYTVHQVTNEEVSPFVDLNFGKYDLSEKELAGPYDNVAVFFTEIRKTKKAFLFLEFFESESHFSFSFEFGGPRSRQHVFVDKNTLGQSTFSGYKENVLSEGVSLGPRDFRLVGSTDEQFVFLLEPQVLLDGGVTVRDTSIEAEDNPILYFVKPKR